LPGYLGLISSICFKSFDCIVTGSEEGAIKLWQQVFDGQNKVWQLQWNTHVALNCLRANFQAVQGLTEEQIKLLQQRDAYMDLPTKAFDTSSKFQEDQQPLTIQQDVKGSTPSSYSPMWQKPQSPNRGHQLQIKTLMTGKLTLNVLVKIVPFSRTLIFVIE
jgi:hypothetical protein